MPGPVAKPPAEGEEPPPEKPKVPRALTVEVCSVRICRPDCGPHRPRLPFFPGARCFLRQVWYPAHKKHKGQDLAGPKQARPDWTPSDHPRLYTLSCLFLQDTYKDVQRSKMGYPPRSQQAVRNATPAAPAEGAAEGQGPTKFPIVSLSIGHSTNCPFKLLLLLRHAGRSYTAMGASRVASPPRISAPIWYGSASPSNSVPCAPRELLTEFTPPHRHRVARAVAWMGLECLGVLGLPCDLGGLSGRHG